MDPTLASISTPMTSELHHYSNEQRKRKFSRVYSPYPQLNGKVNFVTTKEAPSRTTSNDVVCATNSCHKHYFNHFERCRINGGRTKSIVNGLTSKLIPILFLICSVLHIIIPLISADENARSKLPICARYQACAGEISHFPLLSETVGEMVETTNNMEGGEDNGSGQLPDGSGADGRMPELPVEDFPLYDEFVTAQPVFDYNTEAELSRGEICRCPERDEISGEESSACEFGETDGDNIMRVDKSIRLAFCQPLTELFRMKCVGRRALLRIIGNVDPKTGEALTSVNETAVFCRCEAPFEFRRTSIEPWQDKYAFVYRCTVP